jgi:serine/threonine-protein kinase
MSAVQAPLDEEQTKERQLPYVFGRYLLLKRLSRGGMGEIFLAKLGEIQGFEKLVIIKKILPHLGADQEFIKRFIDEAQVAIKLSHANIAPVFEVGRVDGEYFLAIEYVEGRDLRRLVARQREQRTRLLPDLCLFIVRELANGLAYAHRRTDERGQSLALVHCDISPPNVMVSFEGEVKIIDFGIAKSAIRIAGTNPNMGFGKFGYMAPEQLVRGGVVDRRTDVYAAGVVLYELLTGERLFQFPDGGDYRQIARMVAQGKFLPPSQRDPQLDREFDPIVMKALATQKDARYQTAEELRDALMVKLSQMNPTISADALAHFMRGLFREEISEEHQLVASLKAVDVAPYQEELTQATAQHTVTFARAGVARLAGRPSTGDQRAVTDQALGNSQRRGLQIAAVLLGAVLVGGVVGLVAVRARRLPTVVAPRVAAPAAAAPSVSPLPPPSPSEPTPSPPEPAALRPEPVVTPLLPAPSPKPAHKQVRRRRPAAVELASRRSPSPAAVQTKFKTVKKEYSTFKSQYGSVLEERWNAIASEITFGKADKFDKVDAMLDALRREMARIRSGG